MQEIPWSTKVINYIKIYIGDISTISPLSPAPFSFSNYRLLLGLNRITIIVEYVTR